MNRAIIFTIRFFAMIITFIICMIMEDTLHNPDDMLFEVFRFIVFLILLGAISSILEFIYGRFLKKVN